MTSQPQGASRSPDDAMSVCILDDDAAVVQCLQDIVEQLGFRAVGSSDPHEALLQIGSHRVRVVLCDLKMPSMDGFTFLDRALEQDPGISVVFMTGFYSIDSAIRAIKRGACDYLPKPVDRARLKRTLDDLAEQCRRRKRIHDLEQQLIEDLEFHGIIGRSPAIIEVFELARKIARHYSNVLITGPTGSGKELIAHAIHQLSPVANQRFAICNCSAMVDTLLESQLFGHIRGAFTGATESRPGLFEYASGGTVFLDEVGETSLPMQAKLLRVLQNREIQRIGSPEVRRVDVRLIAATNRDLRAEVLAGRFREDLFYRLSTVPIRLPAMAERMEDLPLLVAYFVRKYGRAYQKQIRGLSRRAQAVLLRYPWPGNVRELENVISSAALVADREFIDIGDLPESVKKPLGPAVRQGQPLSLQEIRNEHIERVLALCGGNRVRAAELLGIGRTSLYRYLKQRGMPQSISGVHIS